MEKIIRFILVTSFVFPAFFAKSQTISLGTGTAVNGTTASSPVNIWYRRSVSQTVYTVAELNAAGITGPATINKLAYYITQAPIYQIPDYQISMKHTTAANASGNLEGGYTIVKNAFDYSPEAGGWDFLTLDTPFNWNGTQNIVVRICWTQVQPTYNASGQCRIYNSASGYKYRWNDNAGSSCGLVPNTTNSNKPQINFVFDTVTVWTGSVNSDWDIAGNWTRGVPNQYLDAKIPTGTSNNPNLTGTGTCEELIVEGTMSLASTGTLNIFSHFSNSGTFTDNGGITVMQGDGSSNISGNTTVANLRIESSGGTTVTSGTITISKELQVNNSTFNTGNSVTLKSDASGTARIAELKPSCTYTLDMNDSYGDGWNGGLLTILDDGVSIGTFAAQGYGSDELFTVEGGSVITMQYASGTWENENSVNLLNSSGVTIFTDNAPIATGTIFTTTSSCPFTTRIVGDVSMERYIDAGETYWRNFSSAVEGATIDMYLDDFLTSGFPGSPWPDFPFTSIYTYDETQGAGLGWDPCTGSSQVIGVGQGLYVWSGDTSTGTDPFTLDLVGQPNQGPVDMPVTFTNTGTTNEDGWNLVGNPYASTIDWDSPDWTKTNIANAIYIQDPDNQQYATYVSGASVNGGSRYIASQQSFWVYASAAAPQLVLNESCKSDVDQAFLKAGSLSPGAVITLEGFGYSDESVVRHVDGAVNSFELEFDAVERWGGWGEVPQLSVLNNGQEDLTVHSFDLQNQEWVVPVRAIVFTSGTYNLTFEDIDELDVPCLKLEDTYTGMFYDISEGTSLAFDLSDTSWSPRFRLHIGKDYPVTQTDVSCFDDNSGSFEINLNDTTSANYILTSGAGIFNGAGNGAPLVLENLAAGSYTLEIPSLVNTCSQTFFEFTISEPDQLQVSATISDEQNGNDGSVSLNVTGGISPYTYLWSNAETTSAISDLSAGFYNVTITDSKLCTVDETFIVGSVLALDDNSGDELKIIFNEVTDQVYIYGFVSDTPQRIVVFNSTGQIVFNQDFLLAGDKHVLNLPEGLSAGVYFIQIGTEQTSFKFVKM